MLSKKQIIFIKGELFSKIGKSLNLSVEDVDNCIKKDLCIEKISELNNDEFIEVCIYCFKLGDKLGLNLNFPNNEWVKIYDVEE